LRESMYIIKMALLNDAFVRCKNLHTRCSSMQITNGQKRLQPIYGCMLSKWQMMSCPRLPTCNTLKSYPRNRSYLIQMYSQIQNIGSPLAVQHMCWILLCNQTPAFSTNGSST
jgi:hypothetical protein